MAGRVVVSTLNNDTGVLNTQNGMAAIPKAWVRWSLATSPGTIASSFNVTSVTKNGTGNCTVNFTTAMIDTNYAVVGSAAQPGVSSGNLTFSGLPSSTSSVSILMYNSNFSAFQDSTIACIAVFSPT